MNNGRADQGPEHSLSSDRPRPPMSDTPRTDALDAELRQQHPTGYYPASMVLLARQLERELTQAVELVETIKRINGRTRSLRS